MISRLFFLFIISFGIISCGNKNDSTSKSSDNTPETERIVDSGNAEGTWAPPGDDGIVFHYVCPDRCEGGVLDYEGNCPVCGKVLHHNQAYHFNNNNPTETPAADLAAGISPINLNEPRNTADDPPQSPSGLWHFTCPNGHDGAGEAGNCSQCGEELVHNNEYHTDSESDEPAQNGEGVWHFICPDGHEGGAGAPLSCDQCGMKLVHNALYH